jgi:protein-L-isoaspartate O-methyltransferase
MAPDLPLRETFNQAAELYDRMRPAYPPALVADLVRIGKIEPSSRVLEIGPGTGQLTVPLAEHGCSIIAVELGADLARVARRNLASYPEVEVVVSPFEQWQPTPEPFDVVVAATAFHWLDPQTRVRKAAQLLRPAGILATITTVHVVGGSTAFFDEAQACYQRWDPTTTPGQRLLAAADIAFDSDEVGKSGQFEAADFHRYERDIRYETADYVDTLLTYSGHRTLPPSALQGLLICIASLIDNRYEGHITKRYLHELRTARRRQPEAGS